VSITFGKGITGVVVESEPKAIFTNFLQFFQDGHVVGTLSAVFDFEGLDPELHELALQTLQQKTANIFLYSPRSTPCPASNATDQKELNRPSLWNRVKSFFAGTAEPRE